MNKWISLLLVTSLLLLLDHFYGQQLHLHPSFSFMTLFFGIQTFVLFRLDYWAPDEWKVQISMVKIILRLLSSLVFILVLFYMQNDHFNLVIQFISLYLVYMVFEIVIALTNLRRN